MLNFLKAIEILKSRNQSFVDKNGVSDYSKQSDQIINSMIDFYMKSKALEANIQNLNNQVSKFVDQNLKYKLFLSVFGLPVNDIDKIDYNILKVIDRENIAAKFAELYGFFSIELLFLEIENIQFQVRTFLFPITAYYETLSPDLKKLYPEHTEFFNAIDKIDDNDLQAIDHILNDAYTQFLSRLTYVQKYDERYINSQGN